VQRWLAGKAPKARYIEQLHDFIEGRIAPRRSGKDWVFEPVSISEQQAARERGKMHQLHAAIGELAAGKATLHVSDGVVAILRDPREFFAQEDLTGCIHIEQAGDMNQHPSSEDLRERKSRTLMLRWSDKDLEVARVQAQRRGMSMAAYIRMAIHQSAGEN
jgi:predicted DNA binding CopG/RHH family protein